MIDEVTLVLQRVERKKRKIESKFSSVMQLDFIRRLRQMIEKEGYTVTGKKYRGRERDHKQFEIEGRV